MSTKALTRSRELFPSVMEDFFKPWNPWFTNGGLEKEMTVPAVNISENNDHYTLAVAAPGLKKTDFKIDVEGNMLTISSEKEETRDEKDGQYTRKEYSYSSFSRSFTLPAEVNQERIEATYADGVLNVTLPKKEEAKKLALSKHIAIK
jgi:HSP20 family protein